MNEYSTHIEEMQAAKLAPHTVVDYGLDLPDARWHRVDIYYRDEYYIEQKVGACALTVKEAYDLAWAAYFEIEAAGHTAVRDDR